jgi:hypothetical protein
MSFCSAAGVFSETRPEFVRNAPGHLATGKKKGFVRRFAGSVRTMDILDALGHLEVTIARKAWV